MTFVCRQLLEVHCREVHAAHSTCPVAHILHGLFQPLPYSLKVGVKVEGPAFFEGHLDLDGG
jgi:hypothetical protein